MFRVARSGIGKVSGTKQTTFEIIDPSGLANASLVALHR